MKKTLLERIHAGEVLVADGAMGTMLMEKGLQIGDCPEGFNLDRLEVLRDIARAYLEAGAQVLGTNTFGGSPLKLEAYHIEDRTEEINRRGVEVVCEVAAGKAYVSASCGPSGKILEPYGDTAPERVYESFERQVRALVAGGADMICVETMTDLREATLAVKAAKAVAPELPVAATMTFDRTKRGFFTIMGVTVEKAARGLEEAGADIVGSNCGNGIETMVEIARAFRQVTSLPLLIQSNAGLPKVTGDGITYPESPEFMGERVAALMDIGVAIVGGCCGTTPDHIRAFREQVARFSSGQTPPP